MKRKITIEMTYVEVKTSSYLTSTEFKIYDRHKEERKQQPFVYMKLEPFEIEYLLCELAGALTKIEGNVKRMRKNAARALEVSDG